MKRIFLVQWRHLQAKDWRDYLTDIGMVGKMKLRHFTLDEAQTFIRKEEAEDSLLYEYRIVLDAYALDRLILKELHALLRQLPKTYGSEADFESAVESTSDRITGWVGRGD